MCGTPVKDTAILGFKHEIRLQNKFTFKEIKHIRTLIYTKSNTYYNPTRKHKTAVEKRQ
jgi:hypothetical protein